MILFLISAFASWATFIVLLVMRPSTIVLPGTKPIANRLVSAIDTFLAVRLRIAQTSERWLVSVLFTSTVFTILLALLLLIALYDETGWEWKRRALIVVQSDELVAVISGVLFGVFSGYWLRSIYFRDPKEPTRFSDIVTAGIFLAFGFLGLIGPGALTAAFSRLTALKIGGTELTFTGGRPKGEAGSNEISLAALVPPAAGAGRSEGGPPDTSGGLGYLVDLPNSVRRDAAFLYLRVTAGANLNSAKLPAPGAELLDKYIKKLNGAREFAETSVAPIANCFQYYLSKNGDDDEVGTWLAQIGRWIRTIQNVQGDMHTIGDKYLPHHAFLEMKKATAEIGLKIGREESDLCQAIYAKFHQDSRSDSDAKNAVQPSSFGLTAETVKFDWWKNDFYVKLDEHLREKDTRARPYLAIATASALAFNHEYTAALTVLDTWLRKKARPKNDEPQDRTKTQDEVTEKRTASSDPSQKTVTEAVVRDALSAVFEIRVRTIMAAFLEEWIRYQPAAKTQTVLRYHRNNLDRAIGLVQEAIEQSGSNINNTTILNDFETSAATGECTLALDYSSFPWSSDDSLRDYNETLKDLTPRRMKLALWYSLVTLKRTWVDTALDSTEYYQKFQFIAKQYARDLRRINYSCMAPLWPSDNSKVKLQVAASLDSFARVELANAFSPALKKTMTTEERGKRLGLALMAVTNGLSLVPATGEEAQRDGGNSTAQLPETFSGAIAATESSEYRDRLTTMKERLETELDSR